MTETDTSFSETETSFIDISGTFVAEEDNSWKDPAGYLLSLLARDNEDISLAVNGITISTDITVVTGTYGSLTINKNGYFEYTLGNTNNNVDGLSGGSSLTETITVTYTIDGRLETRSFDITINGKTDIIFDENFGRYDADLAYQRIEGSHTIYSQNQYAKAWDGDDVIYGHEGRDIMRGRGGFDALYGYGGNDRLGDGGGGALIDGGEGIDELYKLGRKILMYQGIISNWRRGVEHRRRCWVRRRCRCRCVRHHNRRRPRPASTTSAATTD